MTKFSAILILGENMLEYYEELTPIKYGASSIKALSFFGAENVIYDKLNIKIARHSKFTWSAFLTHNFSCFPNNKC